MASGSTLGATGASSDTVQSIFLTGVQNLHALEKEARQLLERQIERVTNYP